MRVEPIGYEPFVYNVNAVSSSSLNRVAPIGEDLLASKTDFSDLAGEQAVTINPLKRGETVNFADVLAMQMQMGRMHADRLFGGAAKHADDGTVSRDDSLFAKEGSPSLAVRGKTSQDSDAGMYERPDENMIPLYQSRRAAEAYRAGMNLWTA